MKILWLSRHSPLPAQLVELYRHFPGCEITRDGRPFGDAADIMSRIRAGGYDEVVLVAPLSVMDALCRQGLRPLRAEMEQVERLTDPEREVIAAGRVYRHREFVRVLRLRLETEPLGR